MKEDKRLEFLKRFTPNSLLEHVERLVYNGLKTDRSKRECKIQRILSEWSSEHLNNILCKHI